jgi:hypothetical protein
MAILNAIHDKSEGRRGERVENMAFGCINKILNH